MWVIKWFISAILVIVVIGFAMYNTDIMVTVRFWKWQSASELPLWVVMYASFAAGLLFWAIVSMFSMFSVKMENSKIRKELKRFRDELDRLRNVSVEEAIVSPKKTLNPVKKTDSKKE